MKARHSLNYIISQCSTQGCHRVSSVNIIVREKKHHGKLWLLIFFFELRNIEYTAIVFWSWGNLLHPVSFLSGQS